MVRLGLVVLLLLLVRAVAVWIKAGTRVDVRSLGGGGERGGAFVVVLVLISS